MGNRPDSGRLPAGIGAEPRSPAGRHTGVGTRIAMSLAVAGAVAGAASGCGSATLDASSAPPALRLVDNAPAALGAPAIAGAGAQGFVLRTTLPAGRPAPLSVYRIPPATGGDAAVVSRALGISAHPVPVRGGWVARHGSRLLAVSSDGSWSYGLDCAPSQPIERENPQVMCGSAVTGTAAVVPPRATGRGVSPPMPVPPPPPPGPNADRTRALAMPILRRLGVATAATDVTVGAPASTFTAVATVEGLVVADRTTSLTFDRSSALVSGNGWVGTPNRGRAYPLIDAARAFAMLRDQPRPMPLICRPLPHGRPGCAQLPPTVITDATLGLVLRHEPTRPVLVPAWLFTVQGGMWPLAVVAVDPRFLLAPSTTVPPAGKPGVVQPAAPSPADTGSSTRGSSTRG